MTTHMHMKLITQAQRTPMAELCVMDVNGLGSFCGIGQYHF
jgi:hypothetical protein